jgi:hypothetical protein
MTAEEATPHGSSTATGATLFIVDRGDFRPADLPRKIENSPDVPIHGWCLEVAPLSRYIVIIDLWPDDWAASLRF